MAIFCSAKHAASWLSVTPFIGLGFHLEPEEFHIAVKWWLGLDSSYGSQCAGSSLDPLGHYATTCKGSMLYVAIISFETSCWNPSTIHMHLSVQVEAQTPPTSQDRQIFLYRTVIEESQLPLTSVLSHQCSVCSGSNSRACSIRGS